MPRARPCVGAEASQVDGQVTAGLGAVDQHQCAGGMRDVGEVGHRLDRTGQVAGVLAHDRARVSLPDNSLDLLGDDGAGRVSIDEHDLYAELREVEEGPGDGVMLHRAGDDPVARRQESAQHQVHRLGAARREEQFMGVGYPEERGDITS